MSLNDINSLSHTKRNCKYHIVSICAEIPEESILQRKESSGGKDIETIMRMERSKDNRSRSMPRPCAHVGGNSAENVSIKFYGVPEREEQHNAIWAIRRVEVQVPESRILMQGILRRYGRKEYEPNCGVHSEPA